MVSCIDYHPKIPPVFLEHAQSGIVGSDDAQNYKDWIAESIITTTDIFLSLPDYSLANPIYKIYKSLLQGAARENPDGAAPALSGALTDVALSQPPRATCPVYRDILCIMSEKAITDSPIDDQLVKDVRVKLRAISGDTNALLRVVDNVFDYLCGTAHAPHIADEHDQQV